MKTVSIILILLPALTFAQANLQKFFEDCQVEGSITIYDYQQKRWIFSDEKDAKRETLPASTFKIINSLIALETGVIADEQTIFKWDGIEKTFKGAAIKAWNADIDLENAFKNSTVWYYEELAKRIGKDRYKRFLKKSKYGNGKIYDGKEADFWNYGDLGISPKGQVEFLIRLYERKLPFSRQTRQIVKKMMLEEDTRDYAIYSKTGWSYDGFDNGWYVGYIKTEEEVYFFATRITKPLDETNAHFSSCRKQITRAVFKELKFLDIQ